ncbi:hypothetical protein [Nocardioides sp.]|uniref:hypothetical protein n=1 Tax=Nocardioides sp. TaxID=35761 RepID=UPI002C0B9547|nr:hypothetical protein [Nocardioides sp.]HSX68455.1 hypothetical protein [Nocardioides sp.]
MTSKQTRTDRPTITTPVLLAEPWQIWNHLLPSFDGHRRQHIGVTSVQVHHSFDLAAAKAKRSKRR